MAKQSRARRPLQLTNAALSPQRSPGAESAPFLPSSGAGSPMGESHSELMSCVAAVRQAADAAMLAAEAAGADEAASAALLCANLCSRCEEAAHHAQRQLRDTAAALESSRASSRSSAAKSVRFEEALDVRTQQCAALASEQAVVIQAMGGSIHDAEEAAVEAADAAAAAALMAGQAAAAAADAAAALAAAERQRPPGRGGHQFGARPGVEAGPAEGSAFLATSNVHAETEMRLCQSPIPSGVATPPARPSTGPGNRSACKSSARSLPGSSRLVELTRGRPLFSSPAGGIGVCAGAGGVGSPDGGWGCLNSPGAERARLGRSAQGVPSAHSTVQGDDSSGRLAATVLASAPLITPAHALSPPPSRANGIAGASGFPPPRRRPISAMRAPRPASAGRPTPATTLRPRSAGGGTQGGGRCALGQTPERETAPPTGISTCRAVRTRSFERPTAGQGGRTVVRPTIRPAVGLGAPVGTRPKPEVLVRRTEGGGAFSRLVPVSAAAANAAGRGVATPRRR